MRTYMARLGAFQFGLDTAAFRELQRASTYRWQAKDRIGRKPAQQNTGQGADTITLSGVIFPHWRGGIGQMELLRSQAAAGTPLPLIYAFETVGQYCGRWCVTGIEETRSIFFEDGTPRRIEFRLTLVEYGEDAIA
jgi:phage protein U